MNIWKLMSKAARHEVSGGGHAHSPQGALWHKGKSAIPPTRRRAVFDGRRSWDKVQLLPCAGLTSAA